MDWVRREQWARSAAGLAVWICVCLLLSVGCVRPVVAQEPDGLQLFVDPDAPSTGAWPDISKPGPDMGDFPNSAATLPRGGVYLECAPLTFMTQGDSNPNAYVWPFLFRYGVTDDLEFRVFGNGLTMAWGSQEASGFSPLAFDLKVHLWDGQPEQYLPASSLEVYIQTEWGSGDFRQGTQKSINLNFDLPVTEQTNLEWSVGYSGVRALVPGVNGSQLHANEFSFQWAIEHNLTDDFQVFLTGYYNGAVFLQQGEGSVVGAGVSWNVSDRLNVFGSLNAGLDRDVAPLTSQVGLAFAL